MTSGMIVESPMMNLRQDRSSVAGKPVAVLINSDAGSVLETDSAIFATRIIETFAKYGYAATPHFTPGDKLASEFRRLAEIEGQLIVVAGGDGSVNAVLPEAIKRRTHFAVLPLGTLNLIGKDLGLTGSLEEDVAAIANGTDIVCDAVMVNNAVFHSNAGLGLFVTMALERQAARRQFPFSKMLGFGWAAAKTMWSSNRVEITYTRDGQAAVTSADAVLVTNNRFFGTPWRRNALNAGILEVHVLQAPRLMQRLKVLATIARGTWREMDNLTITTATEVTIRRRWRNVTRLALDGEVVTLDNPLRFVMLPGALRVRTGFPRGAQSDG